MIAPGAKLVTTVARVSPPARGQPAPKTFFCYMVHVTSGGKFNFIIITLEVATRRQQRQLGLLMPQFCLSNNNSDPRAKGGRSGDG